MSGFWLPLQATLVREMRLAVRSPAQGIYPLLFFTMVIALFPLGVGPEKTLLKQTAPGVIWITALLAGLMSAEHLFNEDLREGVLEQWVLCSAPLFSLVQAKVIAHWLIVGVPLALLSPLLSLFMYAEVAQISVIFITLMMGTLTMGFINAIGAALTLTAKGGGLLILLVCLPLHIPLIIFATSAVAAQAAGDPIAGYLAILGAMLLLAFFLAPFAIGAALKVSVTT